MLPGNTNRDPVRKGLLHPGEAERLGGTFPKMQSLNLTQASAGQWGTGGQWLTMSQSHPWAGLCASQNLGLVLLHGHRKPWLPGRPGALGREMQVGWEARAAETRRGGVSTRGPQGLSNSSQEKEDPRVREQRACWLWAQLAPGWKPAPD